MDIEAFKKAYSKSRNGTDRFHFNPLYRKFLYSDGVKECAEAGCYWLLDILGTELPDEFKRAQETTCMVYVVVKDNKAEIIGKFYDDDPTPWIKKIDSTDMPDGTWEFYVAHEGPEFGYRCILLTEY